MRMTPGGYGVTGEMPSVEIFIFTKPIASYDGILAQFDYLVEETKGITLRYYTEYLVLLLRINPHRVPRSRV